MTTRKRQNDQFDMYYRILVPETDFKKLVASEFLFCCKSKKNNRQWKKALTLSASNFNYMFLIQCNLSRFGSCPYFC